MDFHLIVGVCLCQRFWRGYAHVGSLLGGLPLTDPIFLCLPADRYTCVNFALCQESWIEGKETSIGLLFFGKLTNLAVLL